MATRSRIGFETASGSVMHIYCHFDGYVNGVGRELVNSHNDVNRAYALVNGGACRSIASRLPFNASVDRFGISIQGYQTEFSKNRDSYKIEATGMGEEYQYLWDNRRSLWLWRKVSGGNWKRVAIALRNSDNQEND